MDLSLFTAGTLLKRRVGIRLQRCIGYLLIDASQRQAESEIVALFCSVWRLGPQSIVRITFLALKE